MNFYHETDEYQNFCSSYAAFVRNKNKKIEQVFLALEKSKRILAELEQMTVQAAEGKVPDVGQAAHLTHTLRNSVDQILVGLVEAYAQPEGQYRNLGDQK